MDNIYRGESISKDDFINYLPELKNTIEKDLLLKLLTPEIVIEAAHRLYERIEQKEVVRQLLALGIPRWTAEEYVQVTMESLNRSSLSKKLYMELGDNPFDWKTIDSGIEEKYHPLGVILHIGAGNALGLSAFSVVEGLLTGNINILKLPENEGGLSSRLLMELIQIEPRLKPYIYVLDVSSKETQIITQLIEITDGIAVWGSNDAIQGIRQLTPPTVSIIEWGHRLSFSYFTESEDEEKDLQGLVLDICSTDQLYCSAPQCVFYETDDMDKLENFALRLSKHLAYGSEKYPSANRPLEVQSRITWTHELVKMEEVLGVKKLLTDENGKYGVMVDYKAQLRASPLFRNIWVMPVKRREIYSLIRAHKGHLQTVGLSCKDEELEQLSEIFYAAGICRITPCGCMSINYTGEPHDGIYALGRYVRRINRREA
ncbi:MAG: acyl-CoA reductase [Thermotaleaceae bacterium]